jgi:hypothetical protein
MGSMRILPGITTSWARNPPEEQDSVGNYRYQLIDKESTQGRGFHRELPAYSHGFRRKILRTVTISGSAALDPIYENSNF